MIGSPALSVRTLVVGAVLAATGTDPASKTPGADQGSIPTALVAFAILSVVS